MRNNAFALIYTGKSDSNALGDLIKGRCAPALQVGGRYRAVDFTLSNLTNSGIHTVGLITQENYKSLMDHIGSGRGWDLARKGGGLTILPPYNQGREMDPDHSICDAVYNKLDYVRHMPLRYCLLTCAQTVYHEDYNRIIERHFRTGADITVLYNDVHRNGASKSPESVYLDCDLNGNVTAISRGGTGNSGTKRGMDTYFMSASLLVELIAKAHAEGKHSLVNDVLAPNLHKLKIMAIPHSGYVGRLDSVKSYFDVNMDMLDPEVRRELFFSGTHIYTKVKDTPPVRYLDGAQVELSLLGNGCVISGEISHSVLFREVKVGEHSKVRTAFHPADDHRLSDARSITSSR